MTLPESRHRGCPAGNQECPRAAVLEFSCDPIGGRLPWESSLQSVLNEQHSCGRHAREACGFDVLKKASFNLVRTVFMSPPAGRWALCAVGAVKASIVQLKELVFESPYFAVKTVWEVVLNRMKGTGQICQEMYDET